MLYRTMLKNFSRLFSVGFFVPALICLPLPITVNFLFSLVTASLFRDQRFKKLLTFSDVPIILVMCFHCFELVTVWFIIMANQLFLRRSHASFSCWWESKCQGLRSSSLVNFLVVVFVLCTFESVDLFEISPALIPYLWINQSSIILQI